jgi:hypothetical protein
MRRGFGRSLTPAAVYVTDVMHQIADQFAAP